MSIKNIELSIRAESIQTLFNYHITNRFLVNRRYQRKLVWTFEEKKAFIDSIVNGYPVPLILLAENTNDSIRQYEIIDGMQRLNAITSFIEQEYPIQDAYFDLDTLADSKKLKDEGFLTQKTPVMDRDICANISRYQIPLSIYQESGSKHIDEVFRRLNSNGRHLSKQELRQAGSVGKFATIVRKLSSNIRGDSSVAELIPLALMKNISLTSKHLDYGIYVDDVFWVKHEIIRRENLRESKDEEIIADIVSWVALEKGLRSASTILDELYGYSESPLSQNIELQIQKINEEVIINNFQIVFDELIKLLSYKNITFNKLLFENSDAGISRYFQIIFLALYKQIIEENKKIVNYDTLHQKLYRIGGKALKLSEGGGIWSAKEKEGAIDSVWGIIKDCFEQDSNPDPARYQWITRFENILMQSSTEQNSYDFKVGFHELNEKAPFNQDVFDNVIKTLTAMVNTNLKNQNYVIIGVSDKIESAMRYELIYGEKFIKYSDFFIHGVQAEANKYHTNIDKYFTKIPDYVKNQPISERDKQEICSNFRSIKYFEKTILIFSLMSDNVPSFYDKKYYVRNGSQNSELTFEQNILLFQKFTKKGA